jgi:hypothetical protein
VFAPSPFQLIARNLKTNHARLIFFEPELPVLSAQKKRCARCTPPPGFTIYDLRFTRVPQSGRLFECRSRIADLKAKGETRISRIDGQGSFEYGANGQDDRMGTGLNRRAWVGERDKVALHQLLGLRKSIWVFGKNCFEHARRARPGQGRMRRMTDCRASARPRLPAQIQRHVCSDFLVLLGLTGAGCRRRQGAFDP